MDRLASQTGASFYAAGLDTSAVCTAQQECTPLALTFANGDTTAQCASAALHLVEPQNSFR